MRLSLSMDAIVPLDDRADTAAARDYRLPQRSESVDAIELIVPGQVGLTTALGECARVLRPGGELELSFAAASGLENAAGWLGSSEAHLVNLGLECVRTEAGRVALRKCGGDVRQDVHLEPYFAARDLNHAVDLACNAYSLDVAERRAQEEVALMSAYLRPEMVALDWGCGMGRVARALAGRVRRVVAVDLAGPMLEQARAYLADLGNVELHCCENTSFRLPVKADFACTILVLQHLPPAEARRLLNRIADCCQPGAVICAELPDIASYKEPAYEEHTPERIFGTDFEVLRSVARVEDLGRWRDVYHFVRRR